MLRMITTALLLCGTAASAGEVLIPVITGTFGDGTYRTTVDLRSASSEECRFELHRANRSTLRSSERLEPGKPRLLDEFASEFQPLATTVRVSCTGTVEIHSRIHESNDGGTTFDEGALYRASSLQPLVAGHAFAMPITRDFIVAEVHGAPTRVVATLTATASDRIADRQYELEAFGARSVGIAASLRSLGPINGQFTVEGDGRVIILPSVPDASSADIARRAPAQVRAQLDAQVAPAATPALQEPSIMQQLLVSPFKAAPFRDPTTGLVFMRDRWYDPSTGTFLTPDPEGYADSSNPYTYCGGDPVNCSDPTGRAASVSRSGVIIGVRQDGSRYRIEAAEAQADPVMVLRVLESDADLGFEGQEDIMRRAGLAIPHSSACRAGENCLSGKRTNNRAFTHARRDGNWVKNAITATSGLPPQNREQQLVQGGLHIAGVAVPVAIGARARARVASGPSIRPEDAKYRYDPVSKRYRDTATGRFVSPQGLPYPANSGFASFTETVLQPGTVLDRYGRPTGFFASDPGTSISRRGLPAGSDALPYNKYIVVKPVKVLSGPAAQVEEFGAPGGGMQYMFEQSLSDLVAQGVLRGIQ
jgi:RHS repeat-associated protein